MRGDVVQHLAEVGELFGPMLLAGAVEVFDERLHAVEAGFVERFQDVERGEEKRAGAAGRVEDGDSFDRVPEGAQQFRSFAVFDHVLRELADVEVEGDEVIDVADFAAGEFGLDFLVALAPGDDFAPGLGGQRMSSAGAGLFQLQRLRHAGDNVGGFNPAAMSGRQAVFVFAVTGRARDRCSGRGRP